MPVTIIETSGSWRLFLFDGFDLIDIAFAKLQPDVDWLVLVLISSWRSIPIKI